MPLAIDPSLDSGAFAFPEEAKPKGECSALLIGLGRLTITFRDGMAAEGLSVFISEGHDEAVAMADRLTPHLMVVNGGMDGGSLPLLARLSSANPHAYLLFLLARQDADLAVEALAWGAHEVLSPPHTVSNILFRARLLHARSTTVTATPSFGGKFVVVDRVSRTILDSESPANLTGREFELLEVLASAGGQVVARDELLAEIWGADQQSEAVLDATVHRLRRKLEANPANPRILTTVRGVGYRLEDTRLQFT